MDKNRYMKNTVTGVIFPYRAEDIRANDDLVECTADGAVFGKSGTKTDDLYARINELEQTLAEKEMYISALKNELAKLTESKIAQSPEIVRRRELESMTYAQVKEIFVASGATANSGKMVDLINGIIAVEFPEQGE
jgi:predicted RNase H-like nuclease (RuvC/YqgF family)